MKQPPFFLPPADALRALVSQLPPPPAWLQAEGRQRLVLLLNHVLQQEPAATERLRRQAGKAIEVRWGDIAFPLQATPAGLLANAPEGTAADLVLTVSDASPLSLARTLLAGERPPVAIQGDVQLAADVAWLVDNVRWDLEEDLARWLGDAPAHTLVQSARAVAQGFKTALGPWLARVQSWRGPGQPDTGHGKGHDGKVAGA